MLKMLPNISRITQNMLKVSERTAVGTRVNSHQNGLIHGLKGVLTDQSPRALHTSPVLAKVEERRAIKVPKRDEGTEGEANIGLDYQLSGEV